MSLFTPAYQTMGAGVLTDLGVWLSPGSRVVYVHHSGGRAGDIDEIRTRTYTTLNSALLHCRSGMGDVVVVLEGHAESITTADQMSNLVAGTKIVGLGTGTLRPTFTWTATGSTFLLDVANVVLANCILNTEPGTGSVTVTAPMTMSAAGCGLVNCLVRCSTDANNKATVPLLLSDAADDCFLIDNRFYGATAGESTTLVDIAGADRLVMKGNMFKGASSNTAVGIVRFKATAATDVWLENNVYINKKAASTCAVTGVASTSGVSFNEHFAYLDTSSLTPWLTSTGLMTFHRPTVTNTAGEVGTEVVGTVSA
jgi:hypothetical protein